ncbi:uncharacterized protein LOC143242846 isoform X2 [Tachypleus tridentatus]|uniref:uncharacterized protein LOC143242846 isoform X2 n=1 Tax=Tachypleus tridentatus TaxID=6853 RepID=UPI003FD24A44
MTSHCALNQEVLPQMCFSLSKCKICLTVNRRTNIPPGGTCKHFHLLSLQKTAAKHPIKSNPGTFVTRMRDCESSIFLSGLLDVGDEIIEVDKINVKEKDIDEVDHLTMKKNKVLLKILPRSKRNNN